MNDTVVPPWTLNGKDGMLGWVGSGDQPGQLLPTVQSPGDLPEVPTPMPALTLRGCGLLAERSGCGARQPAFQTSLLYPQFPAPRRLQCPTHHSEVLTVPTS